MTTPAQTLARRLYSCKLKLIMRVLIAGGGTGGHVIPALAIARELKSRYNAEIMFVGTARGIENRLVPQAGFGLMKIKVGALKNVGMLTRLRTLVDLPLAILHSRKIIKVFSPDVVVGVGGYASGPAMAAAILGRIPTLAFEPNYVPGFANKMVGKRVSAAAVHFEQTASYFRNAQVVGVPVRQEFLLFHPLPLLTSQHCWFLAAARGRMPSMKRLLRQCLKCYGKFPTCASSIRRESATIMTCRPHTRALVFRQRSQRSLTTCRRRLLAPTC